MSRSRKKHAIVKDNKKKFYNKRFRRACKEVLDRFKNNLYESAGYDDWEVIGHIPDVFEDAGKPNEKEMIFPIMNEVVNQYDVCDWVYYAWDEKTKDKFKRK